MSIYVQEKALMHIELSERVHFFLQTYTLIFDIGTQFLIELEI